jgi:hypothetical protein
VSTPSFARATIFSLTYRTTSVLDVLERHGWPAGVRSKNHPTPPPLYAAILGRTTSSLCTPRRKLVLHFDLSYSWGPLACPSLRRVGWNGVLATFFSSPHTPLHLCPHAGDECEDGRGCDDEALVCMRHLRRDVKTYVRDLECHSIYEYESRCCDTRTRRRRPTSTPRIRSSSTNDGSRPRRVYRRSTR